MRPTTNTVNINNDFINYLYRKLPRINAVGVLWEIACARSTTANNTAGPSKTLFTLPERPAAKDGSKKTLTNDSRCCRSRTVLTFQGPTPPA